MPTPRRLLISRVNPRMGNAVFVTPLVDALARRYPQAQIDLLTRGEANGQLLCGHRRIARVFVTPPSVVRQPLTTLRLIRDLRARRHDLVIDPSVNSTSNRMGVLASGARSRLGFAGPGQWLRLDHARLPDQRYPHQAIKALGLLDSLPADPSDPDAVRYSMHWPKRAAIEADAHWQRLLAGAGETGGPLIGFFSHASARKPLPRHWWQAWLDAVRAALPAARVVELLPPTETEPVAARLACLRIAPPQVLAAALSRFDVFVSADAGPMHLAAAVGVPTLGLFRATDPAHYRPLGPGARTLAGGALTPDAAARCALEMAGVARADSVTTSAASRSCSGSTSPAAPC